MNIEEVKNRIREIYHVDKLEFPVLEERPYIVRISAVYPVRTNDGIEYHIYKVGSGAVSNPTDWFVLNLLRAATDAKLGGKETLASEEGRLWVVEIPELEDYRKSLEKKIDINIIPTRSGEIDFSREKGAIFYAPDKVKPVIITTKTGYDLIKQNTQRYGIELYYSSHHDVYKERDIAQFLNENRPSIYVIFKDDQIEYSGIFKFLKRAFKINTISIEAGPKTANSLKDYTDELFLTVIPENSKVELVGKDKDDSLLARESELNNEYEKISEYRESGFIFRRLRRKN